METNFQTDVNCAACFNSIIDELDSLDGVEQVTGHASHGCLTVVHDLDESVLCGLIESVGRSITVAGNGELVMDTSHALAHHHCDAASTS